MPVTIKTANLKYKNSQGQYVGVNTVGDNIDVDDSLTVAGAAAEAKKTGDEISALKNNIDKKSPAIYKNASGDIVTFDDAADGMPLSECVVSIDPVQDLHGQDSPYPAGGSKNKFNQTLYSQDSAYSVYFSGYNYTDTITLKPNTQYTFKPNNTTAIDSGIYYAVRTKDGDDFSAEDVYIYPCYNGNLSGNTVQNTITTGTTGKIAFGLPSGTGWQERLAKVMSKNWQLEEGSTGTAWSPYSNICPITGWTGTEITRTGFNIWDEEWEVGSIDYDTGVPVSDNNMIRSKNFIPVVPGQQYYMTISVGYRFAYDSEKNFISRINFANPIPENCHYIKFRLTSAYGTTYNNDICINISDQSRNGEYKPYVGSTYPITFPDSAGTVYGGTVDLEAQTLTVDRYFVTLSNASSVSYHTGDIPSVWIVYKSGKSADASTSGNAISNMYTIGGTDYPRIVYYGSEIDVYDDRFTDESTAMALLADLMCVYKLAEPLVYSLTDLPTITTLPGVNSLWSDTGAISVTYPADTKSYVDDRTPVQDVQVNGTSILSNGVANVPRAIGSGDDATLGVVKVKALKGIGVNNGELYVNSASDTDIKSATNNNKPVVPYRQHTSIFYGLAKLAGADMASVTGETVGVYPDAQKIAIQKMLGIYQAPWELIRSDTFTNAEEADHEITVDGNGQAFELTDIVMLFETTGIAKKGAYGQVNFYTEGERRVLLEAGAWNVTTNSRVGAWYCTVQINGLILSGETQYSTLTSPAPFRFRHYASGTTYNGFEIVGNTPEIFTKIVIPAVTGTGQYTIYGKRKWWT